MKINYPTKVEFNKEEYIYLLMQLFAEMGGYASFLLGFSLLDVVTYIKNKMDWINETPLEMKTKVDGNNIPLLPLVSLLSIPNLIHNFYPSISFSENSKSKIQIQ